MFGKVRKDMWIGKTLNKIYRSSFLRWWLTISALYSVSSVCPCCGKPGCPVGFGVGAFVGFIFVSLSTMCRAVWQRIMKTVSKLLSSKT